tara:strand:+ start:1767 stop:2534 length:768 start_codon:yes stop_codon:yes gene_type:complete
MEIKFLQKKPFYIFVIENFLNDNEYQMLDKNFPKDGIDNIAPVVGNKKSFDARDDLFKSLDNDKNLSIEILKKKFDEKFFLNLLKKLKKEIFVSRLVKLASLDNLRNLYSIIRKPKIVNKEIKKNLIQKILYSHYQCNFEFSYMYKNSFIHPHTDQKSKLLSLMLYFPNKNLENLNIGTTFYNSKIKNFYNKRMDLFDKEYISSLKENFEETITFPFKKKNLYCFIKSDSSWHAVKKLEIPENEVRKSININLKI